MICAPILIATLNRDVHFIRLIESLKKNTWAKYTPVFVALDYPPAEKYMEGYKKICKYLEEDDFSVFLEFNVIRREYNYGSIKNMLEMRDAVLKKCDRFIRTDDDAEFSPNFLEYMNKCLEKYKDNQEIIAVTGYAYPVNWKVSESATILKENFICPMWGTGFWRDKYKKVASFINDNGLLDDAKNIVRTGSYKQMIDSCKYEFVNLCLSTSYDEATLANRFSDVAARMYSAAYNKYIIVPVKSKVRNWGFDGSGEYCPNITGKGFTTADYSYSSQPIDSSMSFDIIEDKINDVKQNRKIMNNFDSITLKKKMKMNVKLLLYKVLGESLYRKCIVH